tara:strand:+ start:10427 stop:10789 length:363 start_codon:yes stop_codon:yes gene_type:complete
MPTVITEIESRNDLLPILENNPGVIVIKLGAEWCGPCKLIEKEVHDFFENAPSNVLCGDLDVDESFDLYAYLKQKKIVTAIPALLCYRKNNKNFIPDDVLIGADKKELESFFERCLSSVK